MKTKKEQRESQRRDLGKVCGLATTDRQSRKHSNIPFI
jgi:hypothetical protein